MNELNPYEAPSGLVSASKLERHIATRLLEARETNLTFGRVYRKLVKAYVALSLAIGVGIAYFSWLNIRGAVTIFVGVFLGTLLRDFGSVRAQVKLWPVQKRLFDWDKVQRMANGESVPSS